MSNTAFGKICYGDKAPNEVNVVVEIPLGSNVKYEIDKETGLIFVDRVLFTSMVYPFNYGFIPCTLEEDGDPVDVLLVSYDQLMPGVVVKAKPIGVLWTEDEKGKDAKIIAVPVSSVDARFDKVNDISDLPEAVLEKIKHFFEHYKELEKGKWVRVIGWGGRVEALGRINDSIKRYISK